MHKASFKLVIARAQAIHKANTGHEYGAVAWLAKRLGVSRQTVDNWGRRGVGFPVRYASKLNQITGLSREEIFPSVTLPIDFPPEIMDEIIITSRKKRRSLAETVVDLVRAGLKRNR